MNSLSNTEKTLSEHGYLQKFTKSEVKKEVIRLERSVDSLQFLLNHKIQTIAEIEEKIAFTRSLISNFEKDLKSANIKLKACRELFKKLSNNEN